MRSPVAGPAVLLGAALVGVAWGEHNGPGVGNGAVVLGCSVLGLALIVRLGVTDPPRGRVATALVLAGAGLALVAGARTGAAGAGLVRSPIASAVTGAERATVTVTLVGDPTRTAWSARALARVDRSCPDGRRCRSVDRIVVVDAGGGAATRLGVTATGDRMVLRGAYRPLGPFERSSRWRHAVGAFAADDLVAFRGPAGPLLRTAGAVRDLVGRGLRPLPDPQRSLVHGFLLGGSTGLPSEVVTDFRESGLSHLLVASGENVAFVLVLVGPVLRRLPRWARLAAALGVLCVFAATTRFEPSVLRASVMAACALTAGAAGRPTAGLRTLLLAVTALTVVDPFLVHSVGFRLSVAATAGIAIAARPVAARLPGPRVLAEAVGVTVAAQVAVSPLLVATFGSVPLVALPANLAAAPFVGPLTVSGLAGAAVGGLVPARVVGAVLGFPAWACATVVLAIARSAARFPLAAGPRGLLLVTALGAVGVFAPARFRRATWPRARPVAARAP